MISPVLRAIARLRPGAHSPSRDPRHSVWVESLRRRYAQAVLQEDAAAKQALCREAVYLNITPAEFMEAERPHRPGQKPLTTCPQP